MTAFAVAAARSDLDLPMVWPADPAAAPGLQQAMLMVSQYIGLRTRFFDDFLRPESQGLQTVILGAELDTRAYRLDWPAGPRVLELDHAGVLEFKAGVMEGLSAVPGCTGHGAKHC